MKNREFAVDAMIDITQEKSYNNLTLKALFKQNDISPKDRAFITEIVNGTLRNLILIDYIIDSFSKTKTIKMKKLILNILRISVYQMKFMDKVPVSAICNEAVKIAKKRGFTKLSGFVNGVLRNIARNIDDISYPKECDDKIKYLCTMYSYSEFFIKSLIKSVGYEVAKEICIINNKAPKVCICVNKEKMPINKVKEMLIKDGVLVKDGKIVENALYISKTKNIEELEAFKKGLFHIMDESAMISVLALEAKKGETILDVCASPGGKSFFTSYETNGQSKIIARDIYEHKIKLLKEGVRKLELKNIEIQLKDATIFYEEDEEIADKIILDVPCSGFGIVRKKPDIKYNKSEDDVKQIIKIQRQMLETCSKYVKKGGIIIYSTCTLLEEENLDNINWFIQNFDFKLEKIQNIGIDLKTLNDGYIKMLPNMFETDGFFIAKLKRLS